MVVERREEGRRGRERERGKEGKVVSFEGAKSIPRRTLARRRKKVSRGRYSPALPFSLLDFFCLGAASSPVEEDAFLFLFSSTASFQILTMDLARAPISLRGDEIEMTTKESATSSVIGDES